MTLTCLSGEYCNECKYLNFADKPESSDMTPINNKFMFANVCGCFISNKTKGTEKATEFKISSFEIFRLFVISSAFTFISCFYLYCDVFSCQ